MGEISPLTQYESAKRMLAQAVRVDEVLHVRDVAQQIHLYGMQAKDRGIQADAMELRERAERRLGVLLAGAREAGQISSGGRPSKEPKTSSEEEQVFTLAEVGIDRKLSMKAQQLAKVEETVFEAGIARAREKIVSGGAALVNPQKDVSTAGKKAARAEKEARLGAKQRALPVAKFGVILTDDEWSLDAWSEDGLGKSASNHYPVSSLDELKQRDVASLAAHDCVLFMWTTVPHLDQALELMAHRGFTYKSNCIWKKLYAGDGRGTGYWFWVDHEILLVGTRGRPPAPAPGMQWRSVIEAPVGAHSEKPAIFHELIEAYFPNLPKVELNARARRAGWVCWGYEAPEQAATDADAEAQERIELESPVPAAPAMMMPPAGDDGSGLVGSSAGAATSLDRAEGIADGHFSQAKATMGKADAASRPAPDGVASRLAAGRTADADGAPLPAPSAASSGFGAALDVFAASLDATTPRERIDAAIKAGYAVEPFDMLPIVSVVSVLLKREVDGAYVRKRAHQLGLGNPVRRTRQLIERNAQRATHG